MRKDSFGKNWWLDERVNRKLDRRFARHVFNGTKHCQEFQEMEDVLKAWTAAWQRTLLKDVDFLQPRFIRSITIQTCEELRSDLGKFDQAKKDIYKADKQQLLIWLERTGNNLKMMENICQQNSYADQSRTFGRALSDFNLLIKPQITGFKKAAQAMQAGKSYP